MSILFTVKEATGERWGVYRDFRPVTKQLTAAQAINDARELARMIHGQFGEGATVAFKTRETSIVLVHYVRAASTHLASPRTAAV